MATNLFVYGSLKSGFLLHGELEGEEFLGTAVTEPRYRLYDCGDYPGMVESDSRGLPVEGELYRVSDKCLCRLDQVESVDSGLYRRARIFLQPPHDSLEAIGYLYLHAIDQLRDCGIRWPVRGIE